jgi:hypothetical protein
MPTERSRFHWDSIAIVADPARRGEAAPLAGAGEGAQTKLC